MFDGILTKNTALKINNEDIILIKSKESLFNKRAIIVANTGCKYIYTLTTEGFKDFKANENFALVIGSEQYGISDKWLNTDCVKLKIESLNDVDSINASTAAAISMWELLR